MLKQRHKLLGLTVFIGILMLSMPLFFEDIEIMPYFWFAHPIPPTPHYPTIPTPDSFPLPKINENKIKTKEIFVVQIANLNSLEDAQDLVKKLKKEKFNAFLSLRKSQSEVYIGPELHQKDALYTLNQLPQTLRKNAHVTTYIPS